MSEEVDLMAAMAALEDAEVPHCHRSLPAPRPDVWQRENRVIILLQISNDFCWVNSCLLCYLIWVSLNHSLEGGRVSLPRCWYLLSHPTMSLNVKLTCIETHFRVFTNQQGKYQGDLGRPADYLIPQISSFWATITSNVSCAKQDFPLAFFFFQSLYSPGVLRWIPARPSKILGRKTCQATVYFCRWKTNMQRSWRDSVSGQNSSIRGWISPNTGMCLHPNVIPYIM